MLKFLIFSFLITILFSFPFVFAQYSMELFLQKPDGSILKLEECPSSDPNFQCETPYYDCTQLGIYNGDGKTWNGTSLLSESQYQNLYQVGCIGTATACPSIPSQSSCQQQQGCAWLAVGSCGGTADCSYSDPGSCTSHGCSWHTRCKMGDCFEYCSGTPKPCSSYSDQNSCQGASSCSWPFVCQGNVAPCSSFDHTCTNSVNTIQQGCKTGNYDLCGGNTIVTVSPNYVSAGQDVIVTVNVSDSRYSIDHTMELNLTIDGVPWTGCNIAYINLTKPGTYGTTNCVNCRDWDQGTVYTVSQVGNFSIQTHCTIPQGLIGGTHVVQVIPTTYSQPTTLNSGHAQLTVQNQFSTSVSWFDMLIRSLKSFLGIKIK